MTSNSVDGTGSTAAYQLQEPTNAMTGQAAELHPGSYQGGIQQAVRRIVNMQTNDRFFTTP